MVYWITLTNGRSIITPDFIMSTLRVIPIIRAPCSSSHFSPVVNFLNIIKRFDRSLAIIHILFRGFRERLHIIPSTVCCTRIIQRFFKIGCYNPFTILINIVPFKSLNIILVIMLTVTLVSCFAKHAQLGLSLHLSVIALTESFNHCSFDKIMSTKIIRNRSILAKVNLAIRAIKQSNCFSIGNVLSTGFVLRHFSSRSHCTRHTSQTVQLRASFFYWQKRHTSSC